MVNVIIHTNFDGAIITLAFLVIVLALYILRRVSSKSLFYSSAPVVVIDTVQTWVSKFMFYKANVFIQLYFYIIFVGVIPLMRPSSILFFVLTFESLLYSLYLFG